MLEIIQTELLIDPWTTIIEGLSVKNFENPTLYLQRNGMNISLYFGHSSFLWYNFVLCHINIRYSGFLVPPFSIIWTNGHILRGFISVWYFFWPLVTYSRCFNPSEVKGDFVVTSNAARVVYIVYSMFTIPIMTILISLMSDTLLSRLIKRTERFGVKGGENQTFIEGQNQRKYSAFRRLTRRPFRQKVKKPLQESAAQRGSYSPNLQYDMLPWEISTEFASILGIGWWKCPALMGEFTGSEKRPTLRSKDLISSLINKDLEIGGNRL